MQPVGVRDSIEVSCHDAAVSVTLQRWRLKWIVSLMPQNAAKESRKGACIERQLTIPLDADTDRATITRSDIYLHLLIPRGNAREPSILLDLCMGMLAAWDGTHSVLENS